MAPQSTPFTLSSTSPLLTSSILYSTRCHIPVSLTYSFSLLNSFSRDAHHPSITSPKLTSWNLSCLYLIYESASSILYVHQEVWCYTFRPSTDNLCNILRFSHKRIVLHISYTGTGRENALHTRSTRTVPLQVNFRSKIWRLPRARQLRMFLLWPSHPFSFPCIPNVSWSSYLLRTVYCRSSSRPHSSSAQFPATPTCSTCLHLHVPA